MDTPDSTGAGLESPYQSVPGDLKSLNEPTGYRKMFTLKINVVLCVDISERLES